MNVVDSSGWLEFFGDGPNADAFAPVIQNVRELVVPTITIYEVYKRAQQQRGEGEALRAIAAMMQGSVVDLTGELAISAARLSLERRLPLADSVVLATARAHRAILWTQDADFEGLDGVKFFAARSS
jgi:predicted nucleic acid-binding protein